MFVVEEEGFVAFPVVEFELEVLRAGGWVGGVIGSAVAAGGDAAGDSPLFDLVGGWEDGGGNC